MIIGKIAKQERPFWSADADAIGVFTQGMSRTDAAAMLKDAIEGLVNRDDFDVTVTEIGSAGDDAFFVYVSANQPAVLAALVLKYQREVHQLSLADVAKRLGTASRNAYASYEQGRREPTLSKYLELLSAVAPDMALVVGPRRLEQQTLTSKKRKATR